MFESWTRNTLSCSAALPPIRIVIVDDQMIVRECIRALLEHQTAFSIVGSAATGEEAVLISQHLSPDLIIMDLALPGLNGIDATRLILGRLPRTRVIILSSTHLPESVQGAFRAGVTGYVVKDAVGSELWTAVRKVMAGERYLSPEIKVATDCPADVGLKDPWGDLSQRERDVLRRTAVGASTAQIAAQLALSPSTVDTYRSRSMRRLGLPSRSMLIRFAMQNP